MKLIDKDALVAEIERRYKLVDKYETNEFCAVASRDELVHLMKFINTLEVKEVDLIMHTIIAEGCDWLALHTGLSHEQIEGCRNLMLTIKDEQLKAQKGE